MIIYGWGFFNRRDHSVVRGLCPQCGGRGYLKSYTSSKFFTLYFVPLIPLGRQKIVEECPHCQHARGLAWSDWQKLHRVDRPVVLAQYMAKPTDETAARELLAMVVTLQDRATLRHHRARLRADFAGRVEILAQLAHATSYLCQDREADELYLELVKLSDDPLVVEAATHHLKTQGLRPPAPPNRLWQSLPVLIVPTVMLVLMATYVQRASSALVEQGYVVNGLDRRYSVVINGEVLSLGPHQTRHVSILRYGDNTIEEVTPDGLIPNQSVRIETPWYLRPLQSTVAVINPDEAAVLVWERSGYSTSAVPDSAYQYRLATGAPLHQYDDIHLPFQEFPETVTTSSGGVAYRTRVSALGRHEPSRALNLFEGPENAAQLHRYLKGRLRADDGGAWLVHAGASLLPAEAFRTLAEPRLTVRPVLVEWHRAYQGLLERLGEDDALREQYNQLMAAEPADSALVYLRSRLAPNPDESLALLERAAALPHPSAYAHFGLAYHAALEGKFAPALVQLEAALALEPKQEQFLHLRHQVLLGLQDFATLERESAGIETRPADTSFSAMVDRIHCLGRQGEEARAQHEIAVYLGRLHLLAPLEPDTRKQLTSHLQVALALGQRDRVALEAALTPVEQPGARFALALVQHDLDAALQLFKQIEAPTVVDQLTLATLLTRCGRKDEAEGLFTAVGATLASGSRSGRLWQTWLRGTDAPPTRWAGRMAVDTSDHFVYLCALAERYPDMSAEYLALARAQRVRETVYSVALDRGTH